MKSLKYFVMAALMATAMPLYADMLYWMVDNPEDTWNGGLVNFAYATISAQDANDNATLLSPYSDGVKLDGATKVAASGNTVEALYSGDFISSNVKSFLVELYDENDQRVAWQTYLAEEALSSIWHEAQSMTGSKPLSVTEVVPEPTSGLLLLIGGALLALRRGRARSDEVV